jgi:hypothetical protein
VKLAFVAAVLVACGAGGPKPTPCPEGQSSPCACATGESGAQVCTHGVFGPCACVAKLDVTTGGFQALLAVKMPKMGVRTVPTIEATVIGAGAAPIEAFTLVDTTHNIVLKPSQLLSGGTGREPLALAIVMSGWELWLGNDREVPELTEDDPSRYPGMLIPLREAIDRVDLKNAGPKGSAGMVITYGDKPVIRVPMGPLSQITGKSLGTQKDYFGTTGVELVAAIELGLAELRKRSETRKVMIVIGDGTDTNHDSAKERLAELKKRAAAAQVQVFAIVFKARLSGEITSVTKLVPNAKTVTSSEQLEAELKRIVENVDRLYLTFPGYDTKIGAGLSWDGRSHELVVRTHGQSSPPISVLLPVWRAP